MDEDTSLMNIEQLQRALDRTEKQLTGLKLASTSSCPRCWGASRYKTWYEGKDETPTHGCGVCGGPITYALLDELTTPWRERLTELRARFIEAKEILHATRNELCRWGMGDMHYGNFPQEKSVIDAVARIDDFLSERK